MKFNLNWTKKIEKFMLIFIVMFLLVQSVTAIGITPGRTTIDFSPSVHQEISFKVLNNERKDMNVLFYVEGELAEYVTLHEMLISFTAAEESKEFSYEVTLPTTLEKPGIHEAKIVVMEVPKELKSKGTFVGATASVVTQLYVRVPYPGKYAEIDLRVSEARVNETAVFVVPVFNYGKEDISKAKAVITILGPTNEKIATLQTDEKSILANEKKELVARWLADVNPGMYHATIVVDYDEKKARMEKNFNVGLINIEILDINVKEFHLGGVAKFEILVENQWNRKIDNIFAEMVMLNEKGDEIARFKSTSENIEALEQKTLIAYWDTTGVEVGKYDARLLLHYQDLVTEKQIKADVSIDRIRLSFVGATAEAVALRPGMLKQNSVFTLAILILIIINVAWFVYFKKKIKK